MSFRSLSLLLAFLGLLLLSSCNKRYWYRIKIDVFSRSYTPVNVKVENLSPDRIDRSFEHQLKKACLKQLRKEGYAPSVKDSPRYEFVLTMWVDTFSQSTTSMEHPVWYDGTKDDVNYVWTRTSTQYKYKAPAIIFRCSMQRTRPALPMWNEGEYLYFLNNRFRDMLRSKGMVRYIIRTASRD